jgi:hypothetical protein
MVVDLRLQTPSERAGPIECPILWGMRTPHALAVLMAFADLVDR